MHDVFKARLKAKTKAAGVNLSQKRIDAYADKLHKKNPDVTDEAAHDELIDALDELVDFKEIAKEDDRVRTLEARSKNKSSEEEDDDADEPTAGKAKPAKKDDDVPAWAKGLIDTVNTLKAEKQTSSMKDQLAQKLKDKNIPEKFYSKRALPEKEEELDGFVAEIENDWTELKQENNNLGLGGSSKPVSGTPDASASNVAKDIEAWAGTGAQKK